MDEFIALMEFKSPPAPPAGGRGLSFFSCPVSAQLRGYMIAQQHGGRTVASNLALTCFADNHHKGLEEIDLTGTGVSPAAVAALRKALPRCRIQH